jgi:hypothetical protein
MQIAPMDASDIVIPAMQRVCPRPLRIDSRITGAARSVSFGLEHRDVLQQRNDTDDDDDDLSDLLGASVKRQAADQVENQHDNQEGDQDADENRCSQSPNSYAAAELRRNTSNRAETDFG